ncbi:MAG: hypothetical protein ABIK96_14695 [bacterium]
MADLVTLESGGLRRAGRPWRAEDPFLMVLGEPVVHSLSPAMQGAALKARGLPHEYLPCRLAPDQVPGFRGILEGTGLAGFNVTSPLKEIFLGVCDDLTDTAGRLGAVNTVKCGRDGRWIGHNTDSGGLLMVLTQKWGGGDPPARATVLGAGGSARAAVDALLRWGVPEVIVRTRSAGTRERFADWLATLPDGDAVETAVFESASPEPPTGDSVWISCLPGEVDVLPMLPVASSGKKCLLVDLRYGAQMPAYEPPLGFERVDGLPLLLMQGGVAFAWWFGPPVPWAVMQQVLSG